MKSKPIFSIYQENNHKVFCFLGAKLKIKFDKRHDFKYKRFENEVKKYKYVHLVNNGIHSVNIIKFINKYFDNKDHCFIFPCIMFKETQKKLAGIDNVFYCPVSNISYSKVNKIIIHGLFDQNLVKQLYRNKRLLDKTYWFIWGGDLYSAPRTKENDYVRKNIAGILTSFDKEIYEEKYGKGRKYFDVTYPHDMTEQMLDQNDYKPHNYVHIQINNSTDKTTLEMLDILSKFKNKKIKISTILSYKTFGDDNTALYIMKKGYDIFGTKFNPILEFMPREKYAKHLASVDIYISNQNRQQGNGNASFICSLGKKVYVKSNTSVYKKYNSIGIKYYDTYEIPQMDFKQFCYMDKNITDLSVKILKQRMQDSTKVKQWNSFFNSP